MSRLRISLSFLLLLVFIPAILEVIDSELFIIDIQNIPFSLGRISFIFIGLLLLFRVRTISLKLKSMIGFLLVFFGQLLASVLFGNDSAISKSLAFIILFFGAIGIANLWGMTWGMIIVDGFNILLFIYWTIKSIVVTIIEGYSSYSDMFIAGDVVNHHIPGLLISVSTCYLAVRFFYQERSLSIWGYMLFLISLIICLMIESRSNFLVTLFVMSYIVLHTKVRKVKHILLIIPMAIIIFYSLNVIIQRNEILQKRFTLNDLNYQKKTSGMRVEYLRLGFEDFISNPFGKGVLDIQVEYKGRSSAIHNQFLSFVVSGGIIALLGVLFIVNSLIRQIIRIYRFRVYQNEIWFRYLSAATISCLAYFFTLLFMEMSGLLLFIMISILVFIEKELSTKEKALIESPLNPNQS